MFSKEQSTLLRKEFWTSFGKSFPRKWILYNTKIKGLSFKFVADRKKAMVVLDLEHPDKIANELLFEQLLSLKNILERDYKLTILFDGEYELDSEKKYIEFTNYIKVNLVFTTNKLGKNVTSFI